MNVIMGWVSLAAAVVAVVVGLSTLYSFGVSRRKAAMEEGKKDERFQQMAKDLERAFDKIRTLESANHVSDKSLGEIKIMLANIKESLDKLSEKFDRHCEGSEA